MRLSEVLDQLEVSAHAEAFVQSPVGGRQRCKIAGRQRSKRGRPDALNRVHCGVRMRHLLVLCILSLWLAAGCAKEKTPEGSGRTAEDSQPPTQVSERPAFAGAGPLPASVFHQETATPPSPVPGPQDRKLIREGRATLEVASVDAALARLQDLTRQAGG